MNRSSYALHGVKDNGVLAHAKVIVAAPDIDMFFDIAGMSDRELGSETIDIVEVTVALVCCKACGEKT